MSLRDKDITCTTKQEEGESTNPSSSNPRQWPSGLKNQRIVRVSRTFGGKDRHSKVCTIKGLRDRRIRLSVPTAIQLYNLQHRLGLNQPSKVIDWLLDSTKHDIDQLPPLPFVPGSFNSFHQPITTSQGYEQDPLSSSNSYLDANFLSFKKEGLNINDKGVDDDVEDDDQSFVAKLKCWDSDIEMRSKLKHQESRMEDRNTSHVCAQKYFFPIASGNSSIILPHSTFLNNNMFNYYQREPSNLSLTQLGSHDHHQQSNSTRLPSSESQLLPLCYSSMTTSPFVHSHTSFMNTHHHQVDQNELRQLNRFNYSNPISSPIHNSTTLGSKAFPWSMNHHPHLHQNDETTHHLDKDDHDN